MPIKFPFLFRSAMFTCSKRISLCIAAIAACTLLLAQPDSVARYPVVVLEDTLIELTPDTAAAADLELRVRAWNLATDSLVTSAQVDSSLFSYQQEHGTWILHYDQIPLVVIGKEEVRQASLAQLFNTYRTAVIAASNPPETYNWNELYNTLKQFGIILLIVVLSYTIFWGVNRLYHWVERQLKDGKLIVIKGFHYRNIEVLNRDRFLQLVLITLKVFRTLVVILLIYLLVPTVLSFFPQTKAIGTALFSYVFKPVNQFLKAAFAYVPELILIGLALLIARYLIRFLKFWSTEIAEGRLVFKGFYKDWARPTYNLLRFFIYFLTALYVVQHLPATDTPLFLGILAVTGIAIALATAKPLTNFVSGIFLTYMRSFKVGDRVKVNEASGIVVDRNLFITRIKTKSNEYITVPNSQMMDAYVINYSASESELGLVVYCEFWLSAKIPTKKLNDLLVEAALRADSIVDNPKPALLIKDIEKGWVRYKLTAYTLNSGKLERIKSSLYRQVKLTLEQEGIEL